MNFLQAVKGRVAAGNQAFRFGKIGGYGTSFGDPWGGLWRTLSGSSFDYRREAGILWENSIVMGGLAWAGRNFTRGRLFVERPTGRQLESGEPEYIEVQGHPLTELFNRPNPYYGRTTLLKGLVLSRMVDANAFAYTNRGPTGRPVELYYVPHFQIMPQWGMDKPTFADSTGYIDHWLYRIDGVDTPWAPRDVLHWRNGIDPANSRRGLSSMTSVLREIAADNCASTMSASLLRNNNVPGLVISAKVGKDGGSSFDSLTTDQEDKIREMARTKFSGDRAGELAIFPAAVDVDRMSFSPKEMDLGPLRDINEERVLAQWGIPLAVAGFGSGLEQTKVGATMTAMIRLAWDQCLVPMQDDFAEDLTYWGKAEFGPYWQDGERVSFDRSKVTALQDDVNELHQRVREDWQANLTKRRESRRLLGMSADDAVDDVYYSETEGAASVVDSPAEEDKELNGKKVDEVKALAVRLAQG